MHIAKLFLYLKQSESIIVIVFTSKAAFLQICGTITEYNDVRLDLDSHCTNIIRNILLSRNCSSFYLKTYILIHNIIHLIGMIVPCT